MINILGPSFEGNISVTHKKDVRGNILLCPFKDASVLSTRNMRFKGKATWAKSMYFAFFVIICTFLYSEVFVKSH